MSKSKKLLSLLLAVVMVFSTFAVGASAAYADYKDEAITSYDSIDQPVFTTEQLASIALDAIDAMLADLDESSIKIPVLNVTLDYSSIDTALDSLEDIYNGGVWKTVESIAGEVGKELTFAALNTNPNGNFAANGCRRTTPGKSDVDVLYSVLAFVNDNSSLLAKYGYGTLDLGPTLTGLLGDSVAEYLDAPNLIRGLLYDLAYGDDAPAYEDLAVKPTIDEMLQLIVNDLLIDLEDELEESFEYGITYDFSNLIDIDNGSFYDQFEGVLQYAYNNFLVPWGNTKIKEWIYDLAQAEYDESQKIYRYEYDGDGNQVFNEDGTPKMVKVGYYMDDTAAFTNLRKAPYIYDESAKSVYAANMENGTFNELADVINLNYVIPYHDFQPGEQFFTNFNNILKEWLDVMVTAKSPDLVWEAGSNDMIITNLFNNAKKLLKIYGERFLGDYITIPEDAVIDSFTSLEDAVIFFGKDAIARYADNIILPDSADSVREILAYALCELIADLVPEENVYAKLQSGEINPGTDAGWQAVLAIVARYYANAYTNMNIPAGLGFEETISHAVDWALENYGGILYYTSQIDPNATAWQKLDEVLFTLIPLNWLPDNLRVLNDNGVAVDTKVTGSKFLLLDFILGNILDLKIEHIFDVFDRNSTGGLNNTMSHVLINLVTNILNAVIPGAIPTGLTNFDSIATNKTLGDIIKGLLSGLYSVRENLIPGALPLVSMILGLTGEQELEDPTIDYDDVIISTTRSLSGTEFVVRNNSTGVNTGYTDKDGNFHQDALYQIKIKSITTDNPAVSVTYTANTTLNGGEAKTFPVTGALSADGLVRFAVTYEILDESEKSLTAEPITTYQFTYVASKVSDEDADAISYEMKQTANGLEAFPIVWVDGKGDNGGANNHYIVNNPVSFIGSSQGWGALEDLSFGYGRTTVEENSFQNANSTTTLAGFSSTMPAGILVQDAGFAPIATQYGGYFGSIDFADVNVPQVEVTDDKGNTTTKDADLADYAGTYTVGVTLNVTATIAGDPATVSEVTRKIVIFNDYNLPSMVSSALGSNRQENNFASSGTFTYVEKDAEGNETTYTVDASKAWDNYLAALTTAQAIVLLPKTEANFRADVYEAAANNLKRAIADLDACAEGAGVDSLVADLEAIEGNNEGLVYTDDGYTFFADADYVLYTYNRYMKHRDRVKSLINSQIVEEPGENATAEEIAAYEEALANIPTLTLFEITYRGHMFNMNADRLVRKNVTAASKNYLNNAYNLINGKYLELNPDDYSTESWDALETALDFAQDVRQDTNYAELRQSKINVARRELIQAYKGLTAKGSDPADYTQLDEAIEAAAAIFAEENYEEKFSGIDALLAAYEDALAVARDLLAEDGQALVDAAAAALVEALAGIERLEAGIFLEDVTENEVYASLEENYGVTWAPTMGEMMEPDSETEEYYNYICGLVFDYYDDISTIVGTQGGATYEFEANAASSGALATGDKITLDDGTVYYLVLFGDATGDCVVDAADIGEASDMYNWVSSYSSANNAYFYGADVVRDDMVDASDISAMSDMYNYTLDPYSIPQDGSFMG